MPPTVAVKKAAAKVTDFTWRDSIIDLAMNEDGRIIGVGPTGLVVEIHDQALRVLPRALAGEQDYLAVTAGNDNSFWFADREGRLSKFSGQGEVAAPQTSGAEGALFKLVRLDDGSLLGVGEFGSVVALAAGADSWESVEMPWGRLLAELRDTQGDVVPHLYGICQANDGSVYLTGEWGLIIVRTDGIWQVSRKADFSGNLFACAVSNQEKVLVVGQQGQAYLLETGSWQAVKPAVVTDLFNTLWDGTEFIAVGDKGVVLEMVTQPDQQPGWHHLKLPTRSPNWLTGIVATGSGVTVTGSGGYIAALSVR